jgi:drug/metabolite transporter (DMT)-like permease
MLVTEPGEVDSEAPSAHGGTAVQAERAQGRLSLNRQLLTSATLFLFGTLLTNVALSLLPLGITHIAKASEPLITIVILCLRNDPPEATGLCAALCIVSGVVYSITVHEERLSSAGILCVLSSNACIQMRNILNKDALHKEAKAPSRVRASPFHLMAALFMFALPLQLVVQAAHLLILSRSRDGPSSAEGLLTYINSTMIATPTNPRSDVMKMASTLLLPPFLFAGYQLCSIYVLSLVHPLAHVLVNTTRRGVIIGLGAYFTGEDITLRYMFGAATTLIGMSAFSLSKMKGFSRAGHWTCRVILVTLALVTLLTAFPAATPSVRLVSGSNSTTNPTQQQTLLNNKP